METTEMKSYFMWTTLTWTVDKIYFSVKAVIKKLLFR